MGSQLLHVPTTTTTFVVVNLHCSSCVTNIRDALSILGPSLSISHSIVNHTVSITHPTSLDPTHLSKTLDDAGFELYTEPDSRRTSLRETLEQAVQRWGLLSPQIESKKRKRHLERCEVCRIKSRQGSNASRWSASSDAAQPLVADPTEILSTPETKTRAEDSLTSVVVASSSDQASLYTAILSITGMTCSACSNSITNAFKTESFVQSCRVNLLTNSASVVFRDIANKERIVQLIEDVGFEAAIQKIKPPETSQSGSETDKWKADLAVGGMTCASCVASVTRALKEPSWMHDVSVNLLSNSAHVVFEGKGHSTDLVDIVADVGFDARLEKIEKLESDTNRKANRTVNIYVDGMFCTQCPSMVLDTLSAIDGVEVTHPLTLEHPVVKVEYCPNPPALTIRHIIDAISLAHEAFTPSIHHAMSLEERSQRLRAREQRHILWRLLLSIFIAIPTFVIGIVYMSLVTPQNKSRQYLMQPVHGVRRADWAMFILATPVYFLAADMFHKRTMKELRALWRRHSPTPLLKRFYRFGSMNMLVSLGTSIAYWSSIAELALAAQRNKGSDTMKVSEVFYFDSVVFLTMFLLIGRLIEAYSKARTGDAISALSDLRPNTALLLTRTDTEGQPTSRQINVDLLEEGDDVRVVHGASPPCDGTIVDGSSNFDESSLTGESKPVVKAEGDEVYTGTVNKGSPITVRINGAAGASMLDQIMAVVREGQAKRAPMERLADLLTAYFVPFITLLAIVTWIVWLALGTSGSLPEDWMDVPNGGWAFWSLEFAIAVFVVACPCGLGLAAPTALFVGGGIAAQRGILVKGGGEAFQEASRLDIVAFDKTGTLTKGSDPQVTNENFYPTGSLLNVEALLAIARSLEEDSSHPVARALVSHIKSMTMKRAAAVSVEEIPGKGMSGRVQLSEESTVEALVGNEALMATYNVAIDGAQLETLHEWKSKGSSVALLATRSTPSPSASADERWKLSAMFAISDPVRPEAAAVIRALHDLNKAVWMISGDNATTAAAVGAELGIPPDNIIAEVLPTEKAEKIKYLQRSQPRQPRLASRLRSKASRLLRASWLAPAPDTQRPVVAFVGDGINDAPALTAADVSVAIGSGSDVALASASFVLLKSDLRALPALLALSAAVFARVRANFAWALVYNMLALPVAAGVLFPLRTAAGHVRLDPAWAALAMAGSSVSVVLSSLALRSRLPLIGFRDRKWKDETPT